MIKLGESGIGKVFLGSTEISKAYLGTDLVFNQNSLPYDAQVEYLISVDNAIIDTGVNGQNGNLQFDIQFLVTDYIQYACVFGNWLNDSRRRTRIIYNSEDEIVITIDSTNYSTVTVAQNTIEHLIFNSSGGTINGTPFTLQNDTHSGTNTNTIALFNRNANNPYPTRDIGCHIYFCKIYDGATLVRDFIPVRIGTTGYMFDKVNQQLYGNINTGYFILGNDVTI